MDNSEKKLVVYTDPLFIIDFFSKRRFALEKSDDGLLRTLMDFSEYVLNPEKNEMIGAVSNQVISKEAFQRAIAMLGSERNLGTFRERYSERKIVVKPVVNVQRAITLIQEADAYTYDLTEKNASLTLNLETAISEFLKMSFNLQYHQVIGVVPNIGKEKAEFDYSNLVKYYLFTNEIVIIDPYISTWDEFKIEENLFPLIDSLFLGNQRPQYRINLRIVTLYDRPYEEINLNRKNSISKDGKEKVVDIKRLEQMICERFYDLRFDFSLIYIRKYEVVKRFKTKSPFTELIRNYFHDRNYFSNYIYCKSGNSGDYNKHDKRSGKSVVNNDTDLTLFSLLVEDNYKRVVQHAQRLSELEGFVHQSEFADCFEFVRGSLH